MTDRPPSLRIVVVTQDDPYYVPAFFHRFFERIEEEPLEVVGAVLLRPLGRSPLALARRMWGFYGPIGFLRRGTDYALRRAVMKLKGSAGAVAELMASRDVPVEAADNVNAGPVVERVRSWAPAAILSVSAPQIFRPDLLSVPARGCYNVHCGALPEYRGLMPVFWARYHGEEEVGITFHEMARELDRGGILLQRFAPVDPAESLDDSIRRVKRLSADVVVEGLLQVARDEAEPWLPERDGSYYSFPDADAARRYRRTVGRLL